MSRQRRNFSAKFKSDLVIELLKGEKDLNTKLLEQCAKYMNHKIDRKLQ